MVDFQSHAEMGREIFQKIKKQTARRSSHRPVAPEFGMVFRVFGLGFFPEAPDRNNGPDSNSRSNDSS